MHYDRPDFRSSASQSLSFTHVVCKKEKTVSDRSSSRIVEAHEMFPCTVLCDESGPLSRFSSLQTRFKEDGDDRHHS